MLLSTIISECLAAVLQLWAGNHPATLNKQAEGSQKEKQTSVFYTGASEVRLYFLRKTSGSWQQMFIIFHTYSFFTFKLFTNASPEV